MFLGLILLYLFASSIAAFGMKKSGYSFSLITTFVVMMLFIFLFIRDFSSGYSGGFLSYQSYLIPGAPGVRFSMAVSGFTFPLIIASTVVFLAAVGISNRERTTPSFYGLILFAEFGMVSLLVSRNFLFFYVFWEVVLVPVYFLISKFGTGNAARISLKFFVYTQAGSIFMLLSIFALYTYHSNLTGISTLSISLLMAPSFVSSLTAFEKGFILFGFLLSFLVKMPSFPVHAWFPDSYEKSPYSVTIVLTGALSLMGGYGFFGILFPLWPILKGGVSDLLIALGIISLVYFALSAMFQVNLKRMMAYASAAAMGFVTLSFGAGINLMGGLTSIPSASNAVLALSGGMFQMLAHSFIVVLIFSSLFIIVLRTGRETVMELGGIHRDAPRLSSLFLIGLLASLGLPGLAGFIGEFSVVVGTYGYIGALIFIVIFGMLITAAYHIWAAQRSLYGPYNETIGKIEDVSPFQFSILLTLAIFLVVLGLFPNMFFSLFTTYIGGLL